MFKIIQLSNFGRKIRLDKINFFIFLIIIIGIIYISYFIIEKNQNKVLSSIQNPGDCILAKSQCNTCNRDNTEDFFICTEMVCKDEKFTCITYEKDKVKNLDEDKAEDLKKAIEEISLNIHIPQMPNEELDSKTVLGVDNNKNGVRDKTEIIIYQGLNLLIDDKTIFEDTLQFINLIEPNSEDIILNSKDKHDIYCSYQKLPLIVKKEFPLKFIYDIVLDTQKRKTVFYGSLKNKTNNYRKEECY